MRIGAIVMCVGVFPDAVFKIGMLAATDKRGAVVVGRVNGKLEGWLVEYRAITTEVVREALEINEIAEYDALRKAQPDILSVWDFWSDNFPGIIN